MDNEDVVCKYTYTHTHTHIHGASPLAQWERIHLQCRSRRRCGFDPWVRKIPCRRAWQPTPVFSPGESHGQRTWWATVDRVANSQTQLKPLSTHIHIHTHTHNGILLNLQKKHCHLQQHVWTYRLSY